MKKIIALLMLLVSLATANAKGCDWSSLKLQQWNERNVYKWYVSGQVLDDTCVDYMFMVYDFQTKKTDTVYDVRGIVEVQFNVKGKYKLYLKVWNRCEKCDTTLYRPLEIVQFPNANVTIKPLSQDCKKYKFEMNYVKGMSVKDTCMDYYMVFYKGPWMDTMSQKEWDNLTDYQIGMEYEFPDADFLGYTQTRLADFTFKDSGRVLMYAQWWNKCLRQDTFMFRRLDVCKRTNSSEVKEVVKLEPMIVPNPADGGFIISMSGVTQYEVVDMNGRVVLKGEYREGDIISTENLKEGLYYVKTNRSLQPIVIKH
jgi:hypothetical protein